MKALFHRGDIVEYLRKSTQTVTRATVTDVATNGDVWFVLADGTEGHLPAARFTLVQAAAPKAAAKRAPQTPLFDCLECGHQHSQRACPACGGTDKIDHVELTAAEQAQIDAARARHAELNKLAYAASRQPKIERDAIPADTTRFDIEANSYSHTYFLLSADAVIYVEMTDGYLTICRVDDADLAVHVRAAAK